MNFDISMVPFSRCASYMAFSHLPASGAKKEGIYLRTLHTDAEQCREVFRLDVLADGSPVSFVERATPACLSLITERGQVDICLPEANVIRIRGQGVGLRLAHEETGQFDHVVPHGNGYWEFNSWTNRHRYMLAPIGGTLKIDAPWGIARSEHIVADFLPAEGTNRFDCAIEEFNVVWPPHRFGPTFDACRKAVEHEFSRWLDDAPAGPERFAGARELAAYIQWSCIVRPEGHLARPAMLMSKNWMCHVWSWDNCFNAIALAERNPELAWHQLMLFVDHQDESGMFPDSVSDQVVRWNFCKPPIYGWTLKHMMRRNPDFFTRSRLREMYEPLCRWTEWWFRFRDDDGDGVPQYNHGNDSGWDNGTCFDAGTPVEAPDLSAYLAIQMEVLSETALKLGKKRESQMWAARANELLVLLIAHSWVEGRFIAPRSLDHHVVDSDSLFVFLPIILGKRLPRPIASRLVEGLKEEGRFLTAHGPATESPRSSCYVADGYWRGPIWAPSTMLIVDGLNEMGEHALAREVSKRFCEMCARSGMAENFDALTGAALRDKAYTWTSSVFLTLCHDYLVTGARKSL